MLAIEHHNLSSYKKKVTEITHNIKALKKQIDRLSLVRVALAIVEVFFIVFLVQAVEGFERWTLVVAFLLLIACFIIVVRKQSSLDKEIEFQTNLLWVFQNEVESMFGITNANDGYNNGENFQDSTHPYASDLDIFGPNSLFAKINRASTDGGNELLAKMLSTSFSKGVISERQSAIAELITKIEPTFEFRANLRGQDHRKIELVKLRLGGKLAEELVFTRSPLLRVYVAAVPYLSLILIMGAVLFGGLFTKILIVYSFAHLVYNGLTYKKAAQVFNQFSRNADLLTNYSKAIAYTENTMWESSYIKKLFKHEIKVSNQIKGLSAVVQSFDARLNILVGVVLNIFLMWDVRCSIRLDKWQSQSSANIIFALDRIGHFEELISFAMLSYNHPEYVFPNIEDTYSFSATELGHPLILPEVRVYNNFKFAEKPTVDIITGSNMAGKSTFLRTVGINMVLAYAGSVVCAERLNLSIFSLVTYMRIADSLNESTSTFKAELIRLKMILDHVLEEQNGFVLIDEMLRGTNSQDKYTGSKVFIEKLISTSKTALFATHDLQLSDLEQNHPEQVRNFNFDIQISDGQMHFDYKIKNGACKTFNAAILLKEIGLRLD